MTNKNSSVSWPACVPGWCFSSSVLPPSQLTFVLFEPNQSCSRVDTVEDSMSFTFICQGGGGKKITKRPSTKKSSGKYKNSNPPPVNPLNTVFGFKKIIFFFFSIKISQ